MRRTFFTPKRAVAGLVLLAGLVVGGLAWVSVTSLEAEADRVRATADADRANREHLALWRLDSFMLGPVGVENNRPFTNFSALAAPAAVVVDGTGQPAPDPGRVPSPLLSADLPPWMLLHFELDAENGWRSPQVIPSTLAAALEAEPLSLPLPNCTPARAARLDDLRGRLPAGAALAALAEFDRRDPAEPYVVPVSLSDEAATARPATARPGTDPNGRGRPAVFLSDPSDGVRTAGVARGYAVAPFDPLTAKGPDAPAVPKPVPTGPEPAAVWRPGPKGEPTTAVPPPTDEPTTAVPPVPTNVQEVELSPEARARRDALGQVQASRGGGYEPVVNVATFLKARPPAGTGASKPGFPDDGRPPDAYKNTADWTDKLAKVLADRAHRDAEVRLKEQTERSKTEAKTADGGKVGKRGLAGTKGGDPDGLACAPKAAPVVTPAAVRLSPLRARWLSAPDGSVHLLMARAAVVRESVVYQGVLVDWQALRPTLAALVADLFPHGVLVPLTPADPPAPNTTMSTLPVRLDAGEGGPPPAPGFTPLRLGLILAWAAAVLAIGAVAVGGRQALALSEKRMRFASAVSHELRTPLTALQLHLDLLTSGLITDEEKKAEYLATLAAEADRLNRLVENVLDFARLERSSALAAARPVSVADTLANLDQTWGDRLRGEGFDLLAERHTPAGQTVTVDPRVLEQVLGNLIDNARKYARAAADRRILVRALPAARGRVAVEVEDRGPGVPAADVKGIFKPFRRGSTSTDTGGAGLGLSLAKEWAELFGGSLVYRPANGGGACFRLELPG